MSTRNFQTSSSLRFQESALTPGNDAVLGGACQRLRDCWNRLFCHACPCCGKRALRCCYQMPSSYTEPAPRYFRCDDCASHYMKMLTGPWLPLAASEMPRAAAQTLRA